MIDDTMMHHIRLVRLGKILQNKVATHEICIAIDCIYAWNLRMCLQVVVQLIAISCVASVGHDSADLCH